jgi:carbon storage regulator
MLILTRRSGQSLYLGEDIRVTVLGIQGRQVKIGLSLPENMTVYREEVYRRVMEENRMAIQTGNEDLLTAVQLWQDNKN